MKNYRLHTPEGVRDYLNTSALLKSHIQQQLVELFLSYGYELIETPTFEYLNVFISGKEDYHNTDIYKWMNRQGEIVALRSDMTRSIARVVASQNTPYPLISRYAYIANCFRYPERYQGKCHEFTQAGIELIGRGEVESDAEVIHLAIESLHQAGVKDFVIHIGSASFLEALLDESGLKEEIKKEIYQAIYTKDAVRIGELLAEASMNANDIDNIITSMGCVGGIEVIKKMQERITSVKANKALEELCQIYNLLQVECDADRILFDLSILSYASYYTGMMFQVYTSGIGETILEGGRYNQLVKEFGEETPAVGFAMNIHLLLQKLERDIDFKSICPPKTLIVFDEAVRKMAHQVAKQLRKQGLVVESGLSMDMDEALNYVQNTPIGGILYFKANHEVIVYDVMRQTSIKTSAYELLKQE